MESGVPGGGGLPWIPIQIGREEGGEWVTGWMGLGFPPGGGLWRGGVGSVCAADWAGLLGRLARGVLFLFFFYLFSFLF